MQSVCSLNVNIDVGVVHLCVWPTEDVQVLPYLKDTFVTALISMFIEKS